MIKLSCLMLRKFKNLYHLVIAILANVLLDFPGKKLTVIGVTGTDGKTTTTSLIYHILYTAGHKVAKLTTVDSQINGQVTSFSLHTTTPDSFQLQNFLHKSVDQGCKYAVLEVSSHGIDQNRIWGIPFEIGVLTNITNNEHLDYHGSFENYKNTKLGFLASCKHQVVNTSNQTFSFKTKLLGKFNQENCLLAIATCRTLGIPEEKIRLGVERFIPPPGRLELVVDRPFKVIVDFAHTTGAFEKVLPVVRDLKDSSSNKLIHVFGATGDRDRSKRPLMAKIAARYDDYMYLTHEDTYSEDKIKIINDLEIGLKEAGFKNYERVMERKEAIRKAIKMAKTGDVVVLTGVGHQKTMNLGGKEIPWSDQVVVREVIRNDH